MPPRLSSGRKAPGKILSGSRSPGHAKLLDDLAEVSAPVARKARRFIEFGSGASTASVVEVEECKL